MRHDNNELYYQYLPDALEEHEFHNIDNPLKPKMKWGKITILEDMSIVLYLPELEINYHILTREYHLRKKLDICDKNYPTIAKILIEWKLRNAT